MNFAADSELCKEVAEKCRSTATSVKSTIDDIYSEIDGMKDVWTGASYNSFNEKCHSYDAAMQGLVDVLNAYGKLMDEAAEKTASELVTKVSGALE